MPPFRKSTRCRGWRKADGWKARKTWNLLVLEFPNSTNCRIIVVAAIPRSVTVASAVFAGLKAAHFGARFHDWEALRRRCEKDPFREDRTGSRCQTPTNSRSGKSGPADFRR